MTYGNFAALAQKNLKRMLAYSSIAHAGYMLVGVLAAAVSVKKNEAAGSVLFYLVVYGFATVGALAVAVWLAKAKGSEAISDLNGLAQSSPGLAVCIVLLMLSLIGMPPLAGFFGKLYMFMDAMNSGERGGLTLQWLVMLGLFNSVVSAFYYVRVLKAMFLRPAEGAPIGPAPSGVVWTIVISTLVSVGLGIYPGPLVEITKAAAVPMLTPKARPSTVPTERESDTIRREYELKMKQMPKSPLKQGAGPAGGMVS
jgi:NADH-quinone oxidoreductase subunit N